ncbi:hypothetical protein [Saccharopolyspora griseoalba]|uniref:Uncharacterized protein n=1 Tax=Saccharopolyspora griseoalba TaxID=1431848 RepID=A0ABW2LKC6_9PSEU
MADEIEHRAQGPDPVLLTAGIIAVVLSTVIMFGLATSLQWIFAAGAVAAGVTMLIASVVKKAGK